MGRYSTLPKLFDEVIFISITKLKAWGYLEPNQWKRGTITWSRNGNKTGCIDIKVSTCDDYYLEVDYKFRDEPVNYKIPLVKIPSNLGNGEVWYFVCPSTGKRCRKLFSIGKYFLHREAARGYFYEKQTYSKRNRDLFRKYECLFARDKMFVRYYKKYYKGRPTKRHLKLMNQIEQLKGVTLEELVHL